MQATSTDYLFQSDAQLENSAARQAKSERLSKAGSPIKLPSKPLDLVIRPNETGEGEAWTAESGFVARRTSLKTGKTLQSFKGHTGPVTSLAFYRLPTVRRDILFTASWDKSIKAWDTKTRTLLFGNPNAHTDFVKCLHVIPELKLLISGGSDKDIRVWDLTTLPSKEWARLEDIKPSAVASTLEDVADTIKESLNINPESAAKATIPTDPLFESLPFLASLKGHHTRPVECFASQPILKEALGSDGAVESGRHVLWSADSMGRVCVWELWRDEKDGQVKKEFKHTWLAHETAIYEIKMTEGEAWTVSSDQLATLWTFESTNSSAPPVATLRLPHPYYVKSVLPLEQAVPGIDIHYLLTGCTDEQIRLWDLSLLDPSEGAGAITSSTKKPLLSTTAATASQAYKNGKKPPGLIYDLEGHSHEVVKLALWSSKGEETVEIGSSDDPGRLPKDQEELYVVSAGLDCTIRKWRLKDIIALAKAAADPGKDERTEEEKQTLKELKSGTYKREKGELSKDMQMTAEEEAELAELME